MLAVVGGTPDAVLRVYDSLLSRRGGDLHGDELHAPILRLRVLRSAAQLVAEAKDTLAQRGAAGGGYAAGRGGSRREASALIQACESYAAEARRIAPAGEAASIAKEFERLARELQLPAGRGRAF